MSVTRTKGLHNVPGTVTIASILLLWLGYAILQTLMVAGRISESAAAALGFIPGLLGVTILRAAGLDHRRLFLRTARLSREGFWVLASITVFGLAVIIPFGTWQGWNWRAALVFAPASGISQELFFRSVALPTALWALRARPRLALILHSALFSLWHIAPFFVGAPIWAGIAVMLVPFISGIGWGWQVKRDGTVLWAMVQHSLVWMIAGQFPMPG